jgi:hypothetical protein
MSMTISTMTTPTTHNAAKAMTAPRAGAIAGVLASVFMLFLGTLWRRTGVMPRPFVYFTYLLALVMLFAIRQSLWLLLIFPAWVLLVSVYILMTNLRRKEV